ncbi:hypothetical protein CO2235_60103 [Cupriavidus oxalaticus]|uniref:Uncharacterized protein n=1 Tax=Cupriavidus oxalaticus TaxID=96344 RepID=A0A375GDQ8_9BURK|nr:hypothetical protein CO2235_60103 [Cupriavidus oxalaticus]
MMTSVLTGFLFPAAVLDISPGMLGKIRRGRQDMAHRIVAPTILFACHAPIALYARLPVVADRFRRPRPRLHRNRCHLDDELPRKPRDSQGPAGRHNHL